MTQDTVSRSDSEIAALSLEQWLDRFLRVILRASLIVGLVLIVATIVTNTEIVLLVLYSIAYTALLIAYFVRMTYRVRAGLFLFLLFLMGVSGLLELGVRGDARIFFAIFIIMATILFGNRATFYAILLTLIAHAVMGTLILTGRYQIIESNIPIGSIDVWVMSFLTTALLALVVTTGQTMLINQFKLSQSQNQEAFTLIVQERNKLEARVEERTRGLERRAMQLQAAADVGRAATQYHDLDQLLTATTILISERFTFYHVGIFLNDEKGEFAVLRAANSEGGKRMLARAHKLKVGEVGIVGYVTATGDPRIALDVGRDAVFFNNPDLPETRSEMALPLTVGKKILGALDVQSTVEGAFTEDDITILKVLADQVAVAIENAGLFADVQTALDNTRRAYGEVSRSGWRYLLQQRKAEFGYASLPGVDFVPVSGESSPEANQAIVSGESVVGNQNTTLYVPVKIRGEAFGVVRLDKPQDSGSWTKDEIENANSLAEQLGQALESARLYNEISQRAERENVISEITSKINASIQLDSILRSTVQELGHVLGDSEIILQLGGQTTTKGSKRG